MTLTASRREPLAPWSARVRPAGTVPNCGKTHFARLLAILAILLALPVTLRPRWYPRRAIARSQHVASLKNLWVTIGPVVLDPIAKLRSGSVGHGILVGGEKQKSRRGSWDAKKGEGTTGTALCDLPRDGLKLAPTCCHYVPWVSPGSQRASRVSGRPLLLSARCR
jgi:hypothetical protein